MNARTGDSMTVEQVPTHVLGAVLASLVREGYMPRAVPNPGAETWTVYA